MLLVRSFFILGMRWLVIQQRDGVRRDDGSVSPCERVRVRVRRHLGATVGAEKRGGGGKPGACYNNTLTLAGGGSVLT